MSLHRSGHLSQNKLLSRVFQGCLLSTITLLMVLALKKEQKSTSSITAVWLQVHAHIFCYEIPSGHDKVFRVFRVLLNRARYASRRQDQATICYSNAALSISVFLQGERKAASVHMAVSLQQQGKTAAVIYPGLLCSMRSWAWTLDQIFCFGWRGKFSF